MKNLVSKFRHARLRKLPVLAALVVALVAPTALNAYAQEDPVEIPVANINENGQLQNEEPTVVETPDPTPENTEEPPVAPEEEEVVEPPVEEVDNPEENEDEVLPQDTPQAALDRYIAFAQAEHPGVEIESVKFVWKQGVKSAKITFVDGWKVFVGVSDGSTLKVTDKNNQVKRCQKRMLKNRSWSRWYKKSSNYYQWWQTQQQSNGSENEETEAQEAPTESSRTKERSNRKDSDRSSRGREHRRR